MKKRLLLSLAAFAAIAQFSSAQQPTTPPGTKTTTQNAFDKLMDKPAVAGLIGTVIGIVLTGVIGLAKTKMDASIQERLEKAKAKFSLDNAVAAELRTHVAMVARELFSVQHSIEWLYSQTDDNSQLTREDKLRYDGEIHTSFPKLLGALATVASLDRQTYDDFFVLAQGLFQIDNDIAKALRGFDASPGVASAAVAEQRTAATQEYRTLPKSIARESRRTPVRFHFA
jgi:uncharacterized membrane-anchored protein YhcB (DUF1043 family)